MNEKKGKVYLVGGGPGALELLTRRAMELLERADAIVYDAMAPDEPVLAAPGKKYYVGKHSGVHALPQDKIIELLIRLAQEGNMVVRFKGGDPFVFGRGGEEAKSLTEHGIDYEVVPGVSSGTGVPGCAGLPLTYRDVVSGVTFLTGHAAENGGLELPWKALVEIEQTLVFFMSVATLPMISQKLIDNGMPPGMPAAVIQQGSLPTQKLVRATVGTIAEAAKKARIKPPALVVIGETVNQTYELKGWHAGPLSGRRIVLARAEEREYPVAESLRELGAKVYDLPVVRCVPRSGPEIDAVVDGLCDYDLLIFSSVLAGRIFAGQFDARPRRTIGRFPPIAASSPTVARGLSGEGWRAQIVPEKTGAGETLKALQAAGLQPGARILLPRAAAADLDLPEKLASAGYKPEPIMIYDTEPLALEPVWRTLLAGPLDAVLFTSGTGVLSLAQSAPDLFRREEVALIPMGRKTARILEKAGGKVAVIPAETTVDSLVQATIAVLAGRQGA